VANPNISQLNEAYDALAATGGPVLARDLAAALRVDRDQLVAFVRRNCAAYSLRTVAGRGITVKREG
jgi:phage antirepressor YoqD-like protein